MKTKELTYQLFTPNVIVPKNVYNILALGQLILFLILWTTIDSAIFPSLREVLHSFNKLLLNGFLVDLKNSFWLCIKATLISFIISIGIAYIQVLNFFKPISAFLTKLRFLSYVGFVFPFMMFFEGHNLKLALLIFAISVFMVTGAIAIVNATLKEKIELNHCATLKNNPWQVLWKVIVLGKIDQMLDLMRQNFAIGWVMLTTVEGVVRSEGGIGVLLLDNDRHFDLGMIMAIMSNVLLIGLIMDYIISRFNTIVCPWNR